jgi:hypothetical protein
MLFRLPCGTTRRLSSSGHNMNGETRWGDDCIDACGLERLQPHWPFLDGSELPTHNP